MEKLASAQDREREDHQNFNEVHEDLENNDSDIDDQFFVDDEEEEFFSSPSTNSDGLQFNNNNPWYAYRGRINLFENGQPEIHLPQQNAIPLQQPEPQQNQNNGVQNNEEEEEEETDFLEMDFEPENSEIENENELVNAHHNINHVNGNCDNPMQQALENFNQFLPPRPQQFQFLQNNHHSSINVSDEASNQLSNVEQQEHKYTGAKPKILKQHPTSDAGRCHKPINQRQVTEGDHVFKITGHFSSYEDRFCDDQMPGCSSSSSGVYRNSHHHQSDSPSTSSSNFLNKPHKSPIKSCHNSRKQKQEFIEKQSNQFLFEIEPIKPKNSVTIYTSNCDEKILLDALLSLKLNPNREMIGKYFNKLKQAVDLELVDYIVFRSKLNCNYIKIIELIENSCKLEDNEYNLKKLDINFYPLDFFSTTPEMSVEIEVEEITKRWTSQTDLSPLACIKNKYFHQTNVLGKIVNVIRKMNGNHKPGTIVFLDNETIKIPQYYVSGYITITLRNHQT